jgi:hypothetical protein
MGLISYTLVKWCAGKKYTLLVYIFLIKSIYINIENIPITPSLYNNAVPEQYYGCTQPKEKKIQKKSRYSDQFLGVPTLTPPRQHQMSSFSKSGASKKEAVHKRYHCLIVDLRFSPWRKSSLTKQCLQQGHCQAQPVMARLLSPPPMPLLQVTNHQANSY